MNVSFCDLETAGLDRKRHAIIQLAAIAVDESFSPLEAFEAKITFGERKANKNSLRKNHYHKGMVGNGGTGGKGGRSGFCYVSETKKDSTKTRTLTEGFASAGWIA